jgi:hypothetical protein|tara:strand:+ start:47097 stop:47321 length:225 start_codon:yes stop_codon:yes gene_type:complete
MNFEDFTEYFWAYISDNIVSGLDRSIDNKDFCDAVCFDCYRLYQQSDTNIDFICKTAENLLFNVYRYKPMLNGG